MFCLWFWVPEKSLNCPVWFCVSEECSDWEKELQQELQEYEVVAESDNKDDKWDQEIEDMLQGDDS